MTVTVLHPSSPLHASSGFAALVEAIGTDEFGPRLVDYLSSLCGADHFAVFQLGRDQLSALSIGSVGGSGCTRPLVDRYIDEGLWRADPAIAEARTQVDSAAASLICADLDASGYSLLKHRVYPKVRDRLVVCGRRDSLDFGLSVLRATESDKFGSGAIERLVDMSGTLLSAVAKHSNFLIGRADPGSALDDLTHIARCVAARSELPRREVEVCSRILYGMSTLGISLDIGIGEESVRTYRKRAYQRLLIGSERELLRWYLHQWSLWRGGLSATEAS
jgi:DNA-binding CsgD family transcriptional regulator